MLSDKGVVSLSSRRCSEVHWQLCIFQDTDFKDKMLIVISEQHPLLISKLICHWQLTIPLTCPL